MLLDHACASANRPRVSILCGADAPYSHCSSFSWSDHQLDDPLYSSTLQGSGAKNSAAFAAAISQARLVCDAGATLGFAMKTVDLGGGFVSNAGEHTL